mgnify:CR=1 FL=1
MELKPEQLDCLEDSTFVQADKASVVIDKSIRKGRVGIVVDPDDFRVLV